jgi:WD40 repeat protein
LQGHEGPVHSVAFSEDSSAFTSGGGDCSVRVWDLQEVHRTIVKLSSFTGSINNSGTSGASGGGAGGSSSSSGASSFMGRSGLKNAVLDAPQLVLRPLNTYFTKFSPVFNVGYTDQNLLYAGGPFSLATATGNISVIHSFIIVYHTRCDKVFISFVTTVINVSVLTNKMIFILQRRESLEVQ